MLPISFKIFQFIGMLRLETSWSPLLCLLRLLCRFLRFLCHLTGVTLLNPLEHTTGVKRGWSAAVFPVSSLCRLHRKHFFQAPTADLQVQKSEVWGTPLFLQTKWIHSNPKSRHFWLFMTAWFSNLLHRNQKGHLYYSAGGPSTVGHKTGCLIIGNHLFQALQYQRCTEFLVEFRHLFLSHWASLHQAPIGAK